MVRRGNLLEVRSLDLRLESYIVSLAMLKHAFTILYMVSAVFMYGTAKPYLIGGSLLELHDCSSHRSNSKRALFGERYMQQRQESPDTRGHVDGH